MLGKNYIYKWYDLGDSVGKIKSFALQDNTKNASIRGGVFTFANSFWSIAGSRIAESRLFDFTGRVHDVNPATRELRREELSNVFKIESNFNDQRYFDLNWETKTGRRRTTKAMVFRPLEASNWLCNPVIDWNFQLYSPDPRVYDPLQQIRTWWLSQAWWTTLAFTIPSPFGNNSSSAWILTTNSWNRDAPCKITVDWFVVNPKIYIISNGVVKYFLEINKSTTRLVVDNTNTTAENSDERFVVTDNGANIKQFRLPWWGWPLFIPWNNSAQLWAQTSQVLVLATNYVTARNNTTVTVEYRNTFSY